MKVHITFDLDAYTRDAIGHRTGKGRATWKDCRTLIELLVIADLQQITSDYYDHLKASAKPADWQRDTVKDDAYEDVKAQVEARADQQYARVVAALAPRVRRPQRTGGVKG